MWGVCMFLLYWDLVETPMIHCIQVCGQVNIWSMLATSLCLSSRCPRPRRQEGVEEPAHEGAFVGDDVGF
jgi:hypothetical protein